MGSVIYSQSKTEKSEKLSEDQEAAATSGVEPTRGSVTILVIQLVSLLVATDVLYVFLNFFLMKMYFLEAPLPFNLHTLIIPILAVFHIAKSLLQISFIITIVMRWISRSYVIVNNHFIKKDGILSVKEKIYDLNNVRSVTVHQSILGKLLHFGDVVVETSASGGYIDRITLAGVSEPQKFEDKIRHSF